MPLLAACTTNDSVVELGRVEFYHDPPLIDAPAVAPVGTAITLTVTTYGGGCISFERTDVDDRGEDVVVRPFDRRQIPGENEACPDDLRFIAHTATLTFETSGSKNVRVEGRRVTFDGDEEIDIPLSITIE